MQVTFFRLGEDLGLARFIDQIARRIGGRVVPPDLRRSPVPPSSATTSTAAPAAAAGPGTGATGRREGWPRQSSGDRLGPRLTGPFETLARASHRPQGSRCVVMREGIRVAGQRREVCGHDARGRVLIPETDRSRPAFLIPEAEAT